MEGILSYANHQKTRTIVKFIHRSKVATKIFTTFIGATKPQEKNEKVHGREKVSKVVAKQRRKETLYLYGASSLQRT